MAWRLGDKPDRTLPHDYLHVLSGSTGYEWDPGLFKK